MTWDEIRELAGLGWEIGSHTCTHRLLTGLSDDELATELWASRQEVQERAGSCRSVSYPWGKLDSRVMRAAAAAGYDFGTGLAGRFVSDELLALPRIAISASDGDFRYRLKLAAGFWRVRRSFAWSALEVVRRRGG